MIRRCQSLIAILCLVCGASRGVFAQTQPEDPVSEARMRLGVVGVTPRIAVTNVGVDTNVFNSVTNAQRDFTITATPGLDLWMRTQRGLLTVNTKLDLVYFNKFSSERSVNGLGFAKYEYRFNRVRPFATFNGLNTRDRPGFEIDARARRFDNTLGAGVDVRVGSKSFVELSGRRQQVNFAGDAVFDGRPLNQALNRTLQAVDLTWRQRLTALTTWVVRASGERERFEFETARNGDSTRIVTGVELGRFALIRGSAFLGYRRLVGAQGGTLPEFSGVTSDVNVSYTSPTQTRLSAAVIRDVQYSYEVFTPYYVQTGWTATLTQRITGRWDLQLLGGRDRLSYQSVVSTLEGDRRDRVDRVGGGIGYRMNEDLRASFDVQSYQRQSEISGRDYKTLRAGVSVTYGF